MILLHKQQIVLITPPKCASTTLHDALCNINNNTFVIGPQADGSIDKHTFNIPFDAINYKKILVVRNPYSRAISLYNHHIFYNYKLSFMEFLHEELVSGNPLNLPITAIIPKGMNYSIIKVENLEKELKQNHIDVKLSKKNVSKFSFSNISSVILDAWAIKDCKTFGYNKEQIT